MWSCPPSKRVTYQQLPDQGPSCPRHIWGLIHQGTKPRINPCLRHGYPRTCPGALDISRDFTAWSQTKNPSHILGALSRVFTAWSQTKNPSYLLGALSRVFTAWSQTKNPGHLPGALTRVFCCLVPDQEPQSSTRGPHKGLLLLGPRPRTPVIHWGPSQESFAMALTAWSQTKNPK
jgi:hypothetical protein